MVPCHEVATSPDLPTLVSMVFVLVLGLGGAVLGIVRCFLGYR